jgi:hypothetical protein
MTNWLNSTCSKKALAWLSDRNLQPGMSFGGRYDKTRRTCVFWPSCGEPGLFLPAQAAGVSS